MDKYLFFYRFFGVLVGWALLSIKALADSCLPLPEALQARYPSYEQHVETVSYKEGLRRIAWSRVGPKSGKPVLYAHGNPGSRFELLFFEGIARRHNIAFYLMERPGFGCSSWVNDYQLNDYADDVVQLFQSRIEASQVDAFGWSSGGPPSLALGRYYPRWIDQVVVSSSYTNFGEMAEAREIMGQYRRPGPLLSEKTPNLFHGLVALVGWASHAMPNVYFHVTEHEVTGEDQRILALEGIKRVFLLNQEQAFAEGSRGAVHDLETQWQPWPFDLASVTRPVLLLQGGEDALVPYAFADHLNNAMPNSSLWLLKQQGHLFVLDPDYQEKILQWLSLETHQIRKVTNE